jgi:protein tyrosine/serine phosphatase
MVAPGILRGGQPSDEGYACLKKLGVRTIINLRDERLFVRSEELAVLSLGMNYINVSLSPFIEPTPEQIERCLSVMTDENQLPVFVHCLHGMDRTGTIIAAYRVAVESWSLPRAYVEMLSRGFHPEFSNLTRALEAFCTDRDGTPMDLHI